MTDARALLADADRAARAGDLAGARRLYLDAADVAATAGNWSLATRGFRHAVELDLFDRATVERLATLAPRPAARAEWAAYARALRADTIPRFTAAAILLVVSNAGAEITATTVGTILEVLLTGDDLVEAHPSPRFDAMPLAMALFVVRRALWPVSRARPVAPMQVRVSFRGGAPVQLDELGEWEAAAA